MNKMKPLNTLLLFLFCFAVLFGPAFAIFDTFNYDIKALPDLYTYLGLAHFDFHQSPIRRYRIIVPLIASLINFVSSPLTSRILPQSFPGPDFSLGFSFLLVNCSLMSIYGILIFRLCKAYGVSTAAALVGVLSALTCRWASYIAGLPLVDSLYLAVCAAVLLGLKTQNRKMLIACIFVGPWAKESFVFIAPLIFFFSDISKKSQIIYFALSAALVFSFRYGLDLRYASSAGEVLKSDFSHLQNFAYSLKRLFSFHGIYELCSVLGIWALLFIMLYKKEVRLNLKAQTSLFFYFYLFIVLLHALLSTELARMFYMASAVLAVWIALISEQLGALRIKN